MTFELLLRYLHFISIFGIVGALVSEHMLIKPQMTRAEISNVSRIDAVYGLAALSLLIVGLTLWLGGFGKPSEWYTKNWIFHTKLTCFIFIGLLSIYPTRFFIKNRKGNANDVVEIPKKLIMMIRLQLMLLLIIPMLAGLMSRGIGLYE